MAGFEIRSRRVLLEAGFLSVDELEVVTPDGDAITRFTIEHPGAVAVVALDADGRIPLVRQYRVAADRDMLEIPAGKREPGEAAEATASRELAEEVGLVPGRLVPLAEFFNSPGFCDEYTHVYLALDCRAVDLGFEGKAEERHMTIEWVALDAVDELIERCEIADAKSIVGLLRARAHLGGSTVEDR